MMDEALTLDCAREQQRLKVSCSDGPEKALRPYEIHEVDWQQAERSCREILNLLQRANGSAKINAEIVNNLKKSGHLLFDLLVPPQAKVKLADASATVLTLRLDDSLVHLPWELLHDGREFFCRRFAMGRIASTRQTPTARAVRAPRAPFKVLIIADPRGDLEACYREGMAIKAFLDCKRDIFHVDFKSCPADIAFVKKNLRDYDLVHYAGHATYDALDPSEGGWLLSDGTLKAGDIAAMGGHQPMPALVFSNACQSGQTDGWMVGDQEQRVFGLANAFLLAGVQHYIGTFWETVDEPSAHFARRFYSAIAGGKSIGSSLRDARQAPLGSGETESLAWANYMLYGDPVRRFDAGDETSEGTFPERNFGPWTLAAKARRAPLFPTAIGALLLTGVYLAYSEYYSPPSAAISNLAARSDGQSAMNASMVDPAPAAAPLSLNVNIIGQRKEPDGSYTEVIVREGSVLQSRDHFQVHVETNKSSHVYVLLFDSQGQATQLFPDPKIDHSGFLDGRRKIAVPDKELWFWLDENPGTETVYVLASEEPMSDIRGLLSKMDKAGNAERKRLSGQIRQQIQIVERGVGGVAKGKTVSYPLSDGKLVQKVTDVVAGSGAVVRAISFEHR